MPTAPIAVTVPIPALTIAPARVTRGWGAIAQAGAELARLGKRPLIIGGDRSLAALLPPLQPILEQIGAKSTAANYLPDCCESSLERLRVAAKAHRADYIIGTGGGKALDAAKLVAHQLKIPIATIPSSGATCAAWTALSNVYSESGAFLYDVTLDRCPDLLILDYQLVLTAPTRTLVAGIGDAIAKWYEAAISSGRSEQTTIVAAVQSARVLRDLLLQKSAEAIAQPGGPLWQEVVDASVLMAGVIGGLGGAQCRTVAAHAIHNGLTHISASHGTLHGEKVALGILAQLRLEEMIQGSQLAAAARAQLLSFYEAIGLPRCLEDLGLGQMTLQDLKQAAELACHERSDIHHLPFPVSADQVMAALVSTLAPCRSSFSPDGGPIAAAPIYHGEEVTQP